MKKLLFLLILLVSVFTLSACNDSADDDEEEIVRDNILRFDHLNGHGDIVTRDAYILFEYEMRDYVKYQLAYVACTCRAPEVNFWKVAYVEINKSSNDIKRISFDKDGTGDYLAGFWGDSDPIPNETNATYEDMKGDFIPWLVGKDSEDLEGIEVFTNEEYEGGIKNTKTIEEQDMIDYYSGASVTTNNMIRVMKVLLEYHENNY
ncbi:MAG: hypothetical protein ACLFSU_03830 [Acholeplasmataceae bacterium]